MNRYSHYSEEIALKTELMAILRKYQNILGNIYLQHGFSKLCEVLKFNKSWQKNLLFDYLVFEHKVILKCIKNNQHFFLQLVGNGQGSIIRHILGIQFRRYDSAWKEVLEYLLSLYTQKFINDKLFHLASESFFKLDKKLKKRPDSN